MFTLCERFEGKHKAATQWVDYKLGLSFKQTEFINTEFPHTRLAGLSLLAYYCGSNTDKAYPITLMHLCVCVRVCGCIMFAPTCVFHLQVIFNVIIISCIGIVGMMASSAAPRWDDLWLPCCTEAREGDDDQGSPCPVEGLQVPGYPLCASCSE